MNFLLPILSILGVVNAVFLNWQYQRFIKTGKKMYCLIGEDCSKVVGSKYGRHFGIKNEIIGIGYYLFVIIYWIALGKLESPEILNIPILAVSVLSIISSVYLLYLQAYVVKTFCSWCLIALLTNLLIFFVILNILFSL